MQANPANRPAVKGLLLAFATASAVAQSTAASAFSSPPPSSFTLKLGGQVDGGQGQAYQGKVTWNASECLTLFASGNRSSLASTTQAPSLNGNSTITTTGSFGGDYTFGPFDLGLQYDHSDMSDLLTSRRYYLQPAFEVGSWRLGFEGSIRTTDFERLQFKNVTINMVTGPMYVSGYADLSLHDTGLGANFDYNGKVWRPYGAYTRYSYGSFGGNTDVTRIQNANGEVSPAVFMALSGRLVDRLERMSATRLNRKAALLDSTATAGIEANVGKTKWGLEASQDRDHLTKLSSNT